VFPATIGFCRQHSLTFGRVGHGWGQEDRAAAFGRPERRVSIDDKQHHRQAYNSPDS